MFSYAKYYQDRLNAQKIRMLQLDSNKETNVSGKKRKYQEAFDYPNDYIVVQEYKSIKSNRCDTWIDAYLENMSVKK